jgi:hypothetical protein
MGAERMPTVLLRAPDESAGALAENDKKLQRKFSLPADGARALMRRGATRTSRSGCEGSGEQ